MPIALFGITNDALNLAVGLVILFLIVLYVALIAWTFLDARRRIDDSFLVVCATIAALFPFVGPIVYSILRPPELLADKREREVEIRASELRVRQLEEGSCPNCEHPVERTYLRCPSCRARIKDPCESCGKPIDPRWSVCPYCETPVRRPAPPERRVQTKRRAKQPARGAGPGSESPPKARSTAGRPARNEDGAEAAPKPASSRSSRSGSPATRTGRGQPARQPKRGSE